MSLHKPLFENGIQIQEVCDFPLDCGTKTFLSKRFRLTESPSRVPEIISDF
jgi:hypothetical protein